MSTALTTTDGTLAYDDHGGEGRLTLLVPGAGDVRSQHRFLAADLKSAGYRVVSMDLRGHGDSSPDWPAYGVAASAADIVAMIEHLDAGPATVIGHSFSPTAALWAAADRPDLFHAVVAISPHLDDPSAAERLALLAALRGPLAGPVWEKFYRGWYPSNPPSDLDEQVAQHRTMLKDGRRRQAVRATLVAPREGLDAKLAALDLPVLVIFGSADNHFEDPEAAATDAARRTRGVAEIVDGAGHYPHAEYPDVTAKAIRSFLDAA